MASAMPLQTSGQTAVPKGTRVCFTAAALQRMGETQRKRLEGRVGCVAGYRMGARDPIVDFPRAGRRKELRLFEVDSRQLEIVSAEGG